MDIKTLALPAGQKMAFYDQGFGPPVVILHGALGSGAALRPLADRLTGEGYRVVVPDLLGFGSSSNTEDVFQLWADNQAESVLQVLRSAQIQEATVIGHDFGGYVAMVLQQRAPDIVWKLILVNCNPITSANPPFPFSVGTWPVVGDLYLKFSLSQKGLRNLVQESWGRTSHELDWDAFIGNEFQVLSTQKLLRKMILGFGHKSARIEEAFYDLHASTKFIFGALDPMIPQAVLDQIRQRISPEQIIVSPISGHWIPYENPKEIVRFFLKD